MNVRSFLCAVPLMAVAGLASASPKFVETFNVEKADLSPTGASSHFVLKPGYTSVFEGREGGKHVVLTITVTGEVKTVDGVKTRVVEEKETADGEVIEISRNFFAISRKTGDVYYFGEDTATYKKGKVVNHDGSWISGVNGAHFGMALPGAPRQGAAYYQEVAPKAAMDRGEIVSTAETLKTPAGEFKNCVKVRETTPLEGGTEFKLYAPSVGLVQDGDLKLVKFGVAKK
jgi:hypothetical protein